MKIRTRKNSGLAAIGLLIFVGAILVIAGSIVYMLVKLCRRVFPAAPPPPGTNQVAYVEEDIASLPALVVQLPLNLTGQATPAEWLAEVQRSTNLTDWEPILLVPGDYQFRFDADTNPPPDKAFYRLRYFRK